MSLLVCVHHATLSCSVCFHIQNQFRCWFGAKTPFEVSRFWENVGLAPANLTWQLCLHTRWAMCGGDTDSFMGFEGHCVTELHSVGPIRHPTLCMKKTCPAAACALSPQVKDAETFYPSASKLHQCSGVGWRPLLNGIKVAAGRRLSASPRLHRFLPSCFPPLF